MRAVRPRVLQAAGGGGTPESLFAGSFPAPGGGGTQDLTGSADSSLYVMGTGIEVLANGSVSAVRWYVPTTAPSNGDFSIGLFLADPTTGISSGTTLLAQKAVAAPTASGTWVDLAFDSPLSVTSGQKVYPVVRTNRYAVSTLIFGSAVTNGNLRGVADTGSGGTPFPNGGFNGSGASADPLINPVQSSNSAFYGVDMIFTAS